MAFRRSTEQQTVGFVKSAALDGRRLEEGLGGENRGRGGVNLNSNLSLLSDQNRLPWLSFFGGLMWVARGGWRGLLSLRSVRSMTCLLQIHDQQGSEGSDCKYYESIRRQEIHRNNILSKKYERSIDCSRPLNTPWEPFHIHAGNLQSRQ